MTLPEIGQAKGLAARLQAQGVIIFVFDEDDFGYTSYGGNREKCRAMSELADRMLEKVESGEWEVW